MNPTKTEQIATYIKLGQAIIVITALIVGAINALGGVR